MLRAEACSRSGARPCGFDFAIARIGGRYQRCDQRLRRRGNFIDGTIESRLVGFRWTVEAAEFADKLQRRGADLFLGCRWFEIEQCLDASAHGLTDQS